ncbi:hypothetical protein K443DRAFT_684806 [Laccaria amethystina LaAM-08-1]|uniref:NB-ARC domain-containing protein n=1 Tax=Laccaria amethystina LaAM-08-1 TaxID=1095629 RepID=A0A0C9X626_9AGAR|nr:hypothetical protein K443DRAFT_684806 [Laccaria amethystina LaAM-08-1]
MSEVQVFSSAHDNAVSDSTFYTADIMHVHNINNGNRTTSAGVIPLMPNPSKRFTGRTKVIAELKKHFSINANDAAQERKFFLLHGMGGIGKTQICLKFIEEMSV